VRLAVLLDPVASSGHDIFIPASVRRCIVYRRTRPDIEREATVHGVFEERFVANAGHNDVPHDPKVISEIKAFLKEFCDE
jgi:hypothetical protein